MRGIESLLTPRYQLLPEAKPSTIVGIKGSIDVLFPEYSQWVFYYTERDNGHKVMAEDKIFMWH